MRSLQLGSISNKLFLVFPQSSLSSDLTPIANGSAGDQSLANKPVLIPNGGPSTVVSCSPETPLPNGVANGHITPVQESPFIGYIIAMHRKMVRATNALCGLAQYISA